MGFPLSLASAESSAAFSFGGVGANEKANKNIFLFNSKLINPF